MMALQDRLHALGALLVAAALATGCTTVARPAPAAPPVPESESYRIPIIVTPKAKNVVPKGERIVIADITGDCTDEVKDALMRRLVDNANYHVVTRDNLRQIIGETDQSWAGRFNTETAAKLGKLMGASLWIVGRVSYCDETASDSSGSEFGSQFNIFAILQVIDIETGRVLVASASEGTYIPRPFVPLKLKSTKKVETAPDKPEAGKEPASGVAVAASSPEATRGSSAPAPLPTLPPTVEPAEPAEGGLFSRMTRFVDDVRSRVAGDDDPPTKTVRLKDGTKVEVAAESKRYAIMRAADDMARSFADKFFARPLWDEVLMWDNPLWRYSEAVRLVKLGQYPLALEHMEKLAATELHHMTERDIAEYLHNYGVTLLCANEPERAAEKLRSAYRVQADKRTLEMLGLASKVVEWSLHVEVDRQPEMKLLFASEPEPADPEPAG